MKMTLLDIVQDILSSMDGDEVNSIGDTNEALQIAREVRATYYALTAPLGLPELDQLSTVESLSDSTKPTMFRIPDNVKLVKWIKYKNNDGTYTELEFVEPETFLEYVLQYSGSDTNTTKVNNIPVPHLTNVAPTFWTTFDDDYIICNSYDKSSESTLQESKTLAYVRATPSFNLDDGFIPVLDDNLFPLLLAETKNACFVNFKQVSNSNEQQRARRQLVRVQNDLYRTRRVKTHGPNYGRTSKKG